VVACLGYSRAGAGALIFSKQAPDVLRGMGRCLWSLGALPELQVWDREGACIPAAAAAGSGIAHAPAGRPNRARQRARLYAAPPAGDPRR
jgi:hypothetical protein